MGVLQVTSREFRDKQRAIFDLADKGEKVVIKRGKKRAYVLTPVSDDDLYFTPEVLAKIDKSIKQAKEGKVKSLKSIEDIDRLLGLSK